MSHTANAVPIIAGERLVQIGGCDGARLDAETGDFRLGPVTTFVAKLGDGTIRTSRQRTIINTSTGMRAGACQDVKIFDPNTKITNQAEFGSYSDQVEQFAPVDESDTGNFPSVWDILREIIIRENAQEEPSRSIQSGTGVRGLTSTVDLDGFVLSEQSPAELLFAIDAQDDLDELFIPIVALEASPEDILAIYLDSDLAFNLRATDFTLGALESISIDFTGLEFFEYATLSIYLHSAGGGHSSFFFPTQINSIEFSEVPLPAAAYLFGLGLVCFTRVCRERQS